jgi:Transposase IS4
VTPEEVGAFFGALLLMGYHPRSGPIENYWKESTDKPLYPIRSYISQKSFQQIARYLKINHPNENLKEEDWFKKIEPLSRHFRTVAKQLWTPSSTISVNEVLVQSKGRSKHTLQIDSKAAGEGYKLYLVADEDYCLDFLYSSKATGVAELRTFQPTSALYKTVKNKLFSDSKAVILTLVDRLRDVYPSLPFSVIIDNFFTTYKLFSELRK